MARAGADSIVLDFNDNSNILIKVNLLKREREKSAKEKKHKSCRGERKRGKEFEPE